MTSRVLSLVAVLSLAGLLAGCVATPYGGGNYEGRYGYPYGYDPYYGSSGYRIHVLPSLPRDFRHRDYRHRDFDRHNRREHWRKDRGDRHDGWRDRRHRSDRDRHREGDRHHNRDRHRDGGRESAGGWQRPDTSDRRAWPETRRPDVTPDRSRVARTERSAADRGSDRGEGSWRERGADPAELGRQVRGEGKR